MDFYVLLNNDRIFTSFREKPWREGLHTPFMALGQMINCALDMVLFFKHNAWFHDYVTRLAYIQFNLMELRANFVLLKDIFSKDEKWSDNLITKWLVDFGITKMS